MEITRKEIYSDISSITIDHPLTDDEIEEITKLISSRCQIGQVYFKGTADVDTIAKIKYLIEISPQIYDENVDKFILLEKEIIDECINLTYENPDTWKVSYEKKDNRYRLVEIPKYREYKNYIESINNDISSLDDISKVLYVYDKLKTFTKRNNVYNDQLPSIVTEKKGSRPNINAIFANILNANNIKTYNFEYEDEKGRTSLVLAKLKDEKNQDRLYFFSPANDDDYLFFGISAQTLSKYSKQFLMSKNYQLLNSENIEEFKHRLAFLQKVSDTKLDEMQQHLGLSILKAYEILSNSEDIKENMLYQVHSKIYHHEKEDNNRFIEELTQKKSELFGKKYSKSKVKII